MDVIVAFVTVMLALPTIPFKRAVTVVDPGVIAVSTPRNVLPLLTVATEGDEEVHFTAPVTFCVVPSANVPVAVSCSKVCAAMLPLLGSVIFRDRKSTRLNSSHGYISYAVFCLKKKKIS